jgi:Flp pilus assembly protein TadG
MFRQNQAVQSFRKWRKHSKQQVAERFAFGWRSAFSAAINTLQSGAALAAEVIKATFLESPQTQARKWTTTSFSKDESAVALRPVRQPFCLLRATDAAAIIEFAVALPLLVVLIVGIFDFGGAFNLKQELNNAVREGARFGAALPTNDITPANQKPASVDAIRFLVDSYLQTAKINDCGLSAVSEPAQGGGLVWVYNASSNCAGTLTLKISRGVAVQVTTLNQPPATMLCTTVQISYPYRWHFNNVIQLLVPGANYTLANIKSDATAANTD